MSLHVDNEKNHADLLLIINPFLPDFENSGTEIFHTVKTTEKTIAVNVKIADRNYSYRYKTTPDMYVKRQLENKHIKRYGKLGLYRALCDYTGKSLPWGSLTGIRPTKLFYEYLKTNSLPKTKKIFRELLKVSRDKTEITAEIIKHQTGKSVNKNDIHLYIHIPFCPSKCTYCSFVSYSITRYNNMLPEYVDKLISEIKQSMAVIRKKKYNLRTIYIGGGTPTILSDEDLEKLLQKLGLEVKKVKEVEEFTVESGRPETITRHKLEIMKKYGVTRICVNPQSFNKKVLQEINRPQSMEDITNAINWAKELNLDVNMDLIAGLPGDTMQSFKKSLNTVHSLSPENITVHTLAIKNASILKQSGFGSVTKNSVSKMVAYAYDFLRQKKYYPYYLYRQKHMMDNLENIGYSKVGHECIFNIDSMEEVASILACGAGGISKRFFTDENRIERYAIVRDIPQYIENSERIIEEKLKLFK